MPGPSRADIRDVSTGTIPGNTRSNLRTSWSFAVVWNLISTPLLFIIPQEYQRNHLAAIGFLFPVIGVGLLTWAVITTLRWRRFGPSRFEMSPATLGGQLSGTIHTRLDNVHSTRVTLKLTCLDRITRGSGDNRDTRENIIWREEYVVPEGQVGLGGLDASIPVRFALPADARETTAVGQSDGIVWVLAAEANVPGVDFKEDFDVPVRRGAATGTVETTRTDGFAPAREPLSPMDLAASGSTSRRRSKARSTTSHAHATRASPAGSRCSRSCGPARSGCNMRSASRDSSSSSPAPSSPADRHRARSLARSHDGHDRQRLGAPATCHPRDWQRAHLPKRTITRLDLHISMQSTGRSGIPYYELRATLDTGKHKHLGDGIRNKQHAEWLAERMRGEIGLRVGGLAVLPARAAPRVRASSSARRRHRRSRPGRTPPVATRGRRRVARSPRAGRIAPHPWTAPSLLRLCPDRCDAPRRTS